MPKISEITLYVIILVWFLFININVNPALGQIYTGFTVGALFLFLLDKKKTLPLDKDGKIAESFLQAGAVYAIFIAASSILVSLLEKINIGGLISLLAATTPALAESVSLNFITFAIPVAFIETMFWIRMSDFFATRLNIRTDKKGLFTLKSWSLILALSFAFLMFHITAKGITNNAALMLVFVMMVVSLAVAFWYGEGKQAALFHIFANTIAAAITFGLI